MVLRALRPLLLASPAQTWGMVALMALSGGLYANTLTHSPVGDDAELINAHPVFQRSLSLAVFLGGSYWSDADNLYRPVTLMTLAGNHRLNRLFALPRDNATVYHLVNLILHGAVGCIFYLWATGSGVSAFWGWAAAGLFVAHPIHTEAVGTLVGRAEVLAALWGCLLLLLHRRTPLVAALCYLLALGSKESAVGFYPLVIWADVCLGHRKRWGAYALYGVTTVIWLLLRQGALPDQVVPVSFLDNSLAYVPASERIFTAFGIQLDYLRLLLWPVGLSSDYSYNQIASIKSLLSFPVLGFLILTGAAFVAAWFLRRRESILPLAIAGYAILFGATANVLFPIGTVMGERLTYSPSLMFCLILGGVIEGVRPLLGRWVWAPLCAILVFCAIGTVARNRTWSYEEVFIRTQAASAPNSAKAQHNMGSVYFKGGQLDSAAIRYRRAVEILPEFKAAWKNLAGTLLLNGETETAESLYRDIVTRWPEDPEGWDALGMLYQKSGDRDQALFIFLEGLQHNAGSARLHYGAGLIYQMQDKLDRASAAYRAAIERDPGLAQAHCNLGIIYFQDGRSQEALDMLDRALELDPGYQVARSNRDRIRRLLE